MADPGERVEQLHLIAEQLRVELGSRCGWVNVLSDGSEALVIELAAPRVQFDGDRVARVTTTALESQVHRIAVAHMPDAVVSTFIHGVSV